MRNVALFGVQLRLGVETLYEIGRIAERFIHRNADAGHDRHGADDINGVGDLDAVLGERRADLSHGVGDDVHRPAAHTACVDFAQPCFHFVRRHPVVCGTGVLLAAAADERAPLDAGDIVQRAAVVYAARQLFLVELHKLAREIRFAAQRFKLRLRAVDPDDLIRLHKRPALLDPIGDVMVDCVCHFPEPPLFYIILFIIDGIVPLGNGVCRKKSINLQVSFVKPA